MAVIATVPGTLAKTRASAESTPTATPTLPTHTRWGDSNCDDNIHPDDAVALLVFILGLPALSQIEPCPNVGSEHRLGGEVIYGDIFCDGAVDLGDALGLLKHAAELYVFTGIDCYPIGASVGD